VVSGRVTNVTELCEREKCSVRQINMTISLAFLAPNLVKAAIEGRLPRGIGVERLRDPPTEWSQQFQALGLNPDSLGHPPAPLGMPLENRVCGSELRSGLRPSPGRRERKFSTQRQTRKSQLNS
jgi:hypothetical protein